MENKNGHKTQLLVSGDGSTTLLHRLFNATYHSTKGAFTESMHVFIENGLLPQISRKTDQLSILEFGFGTGLNVLLSQIAANAISTKINYTSLDNFILPPEVFEQLDFGPAVEQSAILQLHQLSWMIPHQLSKNFWLTKNYTSFSEFKTNQKFDLIYYDVFAPDTQPELWTVSAIKTALDLLSVDGKMVTYCAKGEFKRIVKSLGFVVETLPGPPGKREMTRIGY